MAEMVNTPDVGATGGEQDVYKWDTEQLAASKNILTKNKESMDDVKERLKQLQETLKQYWTSTEAAQSFDKLMQDVIDDCGTYGENIDNFNNAIQQVIEIYDGTENEVSNTFGEINQSITKISSVVE